MPLRHERPTARQLDYATALGVTITADITSGELQDLVRDAFQEFDSGPAIQEQFELTERLHIKVPSDITGRKEYTDFLYRYLKVRRWVYSVVRHLSKAKWRLYSESGMPEHTIAQIAHALMADEVLFDNVLGKTPGNSRKGADVWIRMSRRDISCPEFQLVKNFKLPGEIVAQIKAFREQPKPTAKLRQRTRGKQKPQGCLTVAVCLAAAVLLIVSLA